MEYSQLIDQLFCLMDKKYNKSFDYPTEIATRLGIDLRTAKRKLKGEARFSAVEVLEIANKFSLSLDSIYTEKSNISTLALNNFPNLSGIRFMNL